MAYLIIIIRNYWTGRYAKVADLVQEAKDIIGLGLQAQYSAIALAEKKVRKLLCKEYCTMANIP